MTATTTASSTVTTLLDQQMEATLMKRQAIAKLRRLVVNPTDSIDFSSNDFLGLASSTTMRADYLAELQSMPQILGSTGSRLLDGNSGYVQNLEQRIADFHGAPSALIFNSGFDANAGLFSTVPQVGDVILYDELVHASVHEGMKISRAKHRIPFAHSDVDDLKRCLEKALNDTQGKKNVFVAVETVYSMDGDVAPLVEIMQLLRSYWPSGENGFLIVDEVNDLNVLGAGSDLIRSDYFCVCRHMQLVSMEIVGVALSLNWGWNPWYLHDYIPLAKHWQAMEVRERKPQPSRYEMTHAFS
jgi:8-amino-7-oxononanoate synthase